MSAGSPVFLLREVGRESILDSPDMADSDKPKIEIDGQMLHDLATGKITSIEISKDKIPHDLGKGFNVVAGDPVSNRGGRPGGG